MKRLRRDEVTLNVTSSGLVIRGLTDGGLSSSLPDLSKMCLQTINCVFITSKTMCHTSNTCNSFKKSKRDISVIYG